MLKGLERRQQIQEAQCGTAQAELRTQPSDIKKVIKRTIGLGFQLLNRQCKLMSQEDFRGHFTRMGKNAWII